MSIWVGSTYIVSSGPAPERNIEGTRLSSHVFPRLKAQGLSLLSGGEKAMAAIALIFSLFRVEPSPFCLFDDVHAPLMECADVLYGVSTPEPGISRLVTVKLD